MILDQSYTDVAESDSYWENRNPDWGEATNEAKEAALIRATEFIDTGFSWIGQVAEPGQPLSWPRSNAYDHEGRLREDIPQELKNATAWLAFQALDVELDPAQARGGDIRRVQAGSVQVEWNPLAPTGTSYRHIGRMLRNLITSNKMRLS